MFGTIAKLFKRSPKPSVAAARSAAPQSKPELTKAARTLPKAGTLPAAGTGLSPRATASATPGGSSITISFASIIHCVPQELWGKLAPAGAGTVTLAVPRAQVVEQLPQGAVKISFSEIRRQAPAGLFATNASQDSRLVDLPLAEILAQLHPDAFARRPDQCPVEISEEVPDLFGAKGERCSPLRVLDKQEAAAVTAATRQNRPHGREILPVSTPSIQTPPPKAASALTSQQAPTHNRSAPIKPSVPLPSQTPASARPASHTPNPIPKAPTSPAAPVAARSLPKFTPAPKSAATSPVPPAEVAKSIPVPLPKPGPDSFLIPLAAVVEDWPDEVRTELASMKIPSAYLAIPAAEVCEGLKRRLVQFHWKTLRLWLLPQQLGGNSPFDDVVLELPLKTITPLFLDHIRSNPSQLKVANSERITEFFRRVEQSAPAAPPAAPQVAVPLMASAPSKSSAHPTVDPAAAEGTIDIPVSKASAFWPDVVKHDVTQFNLSQCVVSVPADYIEAGLKTGKVEFTWRQICSWLKPVSAPAKLSINGELTVGFPLNLVAPLFLQSNRGQQTRRKTQVDEDIPDLFSAGGLLQPPAPPASAALTAPAAPAARPSATPPPAVPAATPSASKATPRSLAELFNEPDKRSWTPNDIVHRTAQLPGVAGALIALQDGLLVAACMPPETPTETIAAFVPQIFGRMGQYTRELKLGDTKGISFTVETCTLQIINAGIIYFAALSKPNCPLPLAELQLIATELGRHTK